LQRGGVGDVGADPDRAVGTQGCCRPLDLFGLEIEQRDVGPACDERLGDAETDTARAARDQGDLSLQRVTGHGLRIVARKREPGCAGEGLMSAGFVPATVGLTADRTK
jgi:hypothetical protein